MLLAMACVHYLLAGSSHPERRFSLPLAWVPLLRQAGPGSTMATIHGNGLKTLSPTLKQLFSSWRGTPVARSADQHKLSPKLCAGPLPGTNILDG